MTLTTQEQMKRLITNAKTTGSNHKPVIKLFGGGACTWLLSEYDPKTDCFFGLCDLGMGEPELGYVSKAELEEIRFPPFNLPVERDLHFHPDKTLKEYANLARINRRIVI